MARFGYQAVSQHVQHVRVFLIGRRQVLQLTVTPDRGGMAYKPQWSRPALKEVTQQYVVKLLLEESVRVSQRLAGAEGSVSHPPMPWVDFHYLYQGMRNRVCAAVPCVCVLVYCVCVVL